MAKRDVREAGASTSEQRFKGQRVALAGKLAALRKDEVVKVLEDEGATVADKLGKDTTLFVFAVAGSVDHRRAQKMASEGAAIVVVDEEEFRRRYLLPTADEAYAMLGDKKRGRTRLANLLELNRPPYMRTTDEYSTIRLEGRSLRGANLSDVSLCGVHFIECDLREANLTKARWLAEASKSDFRKATAKHCELVEVRDCDFRECQLREASLRDVEGCRFDGANLEHANVAGDLSKCRFDGATLDGFEASHATLRGCSFEKASLQSATLEQLELEDCNFAHADLRGATFKGDSDPLVFKNCNFREADLRNAVLSHVRFDGCDLTGAQFDGVTVAQLELVDTDGSKAKGLDAAPPEHGPAYRALQVAAPTFKNITVTVMLRVRSKKLECTLYQFDHSANTSCRQAWLAGDNVGALPIADAIATIAKLNPGAKLDDATLVVKATKGKVSPTLKPKALEQAVLAAWREALGA